MINNIVLKSFIPVGCVVLCGIALFGGRGDAQANSVSAGAVATNSIALHGRDSRIAGGVVLKPHERKVLWALNRQEASGRKFVKARYEPGFYRRYLQDNRRFREADQTYGQHAIASSYGPWQIMYATAVQMGYGGAPQALSHSFVSLPYVVKYLRYLYKRFDGDVRSVISAYNAGPGGVGTNPRYTQRVLAYLGQAPEQWRVYGT